MTITEQLGNQRKPVLVALGVLLLVLVTAGDYLTHTYYGMEFSPFYLVPVSFFSWFLGKRIGFGVAVASVIIGFFIKLREIPGSIGYWDALIRLALYICSTLMIAQLKKLYEHERHLSRIDPLTRIENRRAFFESAAREQSSSERQGLPLSIAYVDVDGFKQINDRFGHTTGDRILATTAAAIGKALRPTDIVARFGGDEFAILLPATEKEAADRILSRVRDQLDRAMTKRGWAVTFSIGIVSFSPPLSSVREMLRAADEAMYAIKKSRKGELGQRNRVA
jgi:diguanylate cyclase (GGDEF)-like protein